MLNRESHKLFKIFEIYSEYLKMDSTQRKNSFTYQSAKRIIDSLQIVNYTTEREVKLMENFNERFKKKP